MRRRWYEHTKYEPNPVLIVCVAIAGALLAIGFLAFVLMVGFG